MFQLIRGASMIIKKLIVTGLAGAFLLANMVNAMYIDFTDIAFADVQGLNSATVDIEGTDLKLTFDAYPIDPLATLTYNNDAGGMDGIGIDGPIDGSGGIDEIGKSEILSINFSKVVTLTQISITDLFYERDKYDEFENETDIYEYGSYSLFDADGNNIESNNFIATKGVANGVKEITGLFFDNVKKISFKNDNTLVSDYSVRGLGVKTTNVPEPGFITLCVMCILALGGLHFFFRKKIITL